MGSAAGEQNATDGSFAAAARFAGAEVDAVLELEEPAHAVCVDIIRDRRAAQPDGMLEDLAESLAQSLELVTGESACGAAGTDASVEEALVGINVAHPGEEGLVEQGGLDGELAAAEECGKAGGVDRERFAAGGIEGWRANEIAEFETAETAGIDEAQLSTAHEAEPGMGVRGDWLVGSGDEQAAGHAQMDDPLGICLRG